MAVAHKDRIDRLNLLKQLIPRNCSDQGGPDARQLLARLAEHYEASKSDAARMRAISCTYSAAVCLRFIAFRMRSLPDCTGRCR